MTKEETIDKKVEEEDNILDKNGSKNDSNIEKEEDKSIEEKFKEIEDKLTRTFAEMENQRRRFEKEKDEAFEYGGFTFAKETLNLIEILEWSKQSLEDDEKLKNTDALKKISEHLEIINRDMLNIFKKNNIEPINSINKKLDPNLHQAMIEIEDDSKEPGTVVQEIQKGFMIKERLLRPSLVAVSKKTIKTNIKKDKNNEKKQEKKDEN